MPYLRELLPILNTPGLKKELKAKVEKGPEEAICAYDKCSKSFPKGNQPNKKYCCHKCENAANFRAWKRKHPSKRGKGRPRKEVVV